MSLVNGLAAGYLGGRLFHYIFVFALIFAVTFLSEKMGPGQSAIIQASFICVVFPVVFSFLFKQKVFRRGLRSLMFIAHRNILFVFGTAFAGLGYMQTQNPDMTRPLYAQETEIINSLPPAIRDVVSTLSFGQMTMIMGAIMIVPAIVMWLYGRSVERRYGQAIYDRDVAVVRDGINQSR